MLIEQIRLFKSKYASKPMKNSGHFTFVGEFNQELGERETRNVMSPDQTQNDNLS